MNPAAVLGLIGDLYVQIEALQRENEALKAAESEKASEGVVQEPVPLATGGPEFIHDPLAGPEETIAQARKESEGEK